MGEEEFLRKVLEIVNYDYEVLEHKVNTFLEQTQIPSANED